MVDDQVKLRQSKGRADSAIPRIKVYPNPTANWIIVEGVKDGESITITTSTGVVVQRTTVQNSQLDLRELEGGIYYLQFDRLNKTIKQIKI